MKEKYVYELVDSILGKGSKELVDILRNKRDINEFLIAKKMKMTINQTRNLLYKLHDANVVSFIRKKDKRKGWYIYYWTLNMNKSLEALMEVKNKIIENLRKQLASKKEKTFYTCPSACIEVSEDTSLSYDFMCPECGELLQPIDSSGEEKEILKKIEKNEKELKELKVLNDKEGQKREKMLIKQGKMKAKKGKTKIKPKKVKKKARKVKRKLKKVLKKKKINKKKNTKKIKPKKVKLKKKKQIKKKKR
ncbi:hypothetical protein AUJ10_00760 [Candidatus Pacearchaeota archaeon CG1_02_31_27]|nr:MAG: hypothetical protein AUJ10_00760 [Candidatus Pacearchaeota archaeon CG1_02_31_27]PIN92345.1 MAG: hypothetical protein COU55_00870 [Candidatus Pacearchaeota archaeon CG10_big_fil_rev_8_21_14_0_10_31_59]PIZ80762.1 MAG: hypothetical protein COX99_01760 [Candidatus Pacearchaeota archaeon CG_4_10_14_0_2_um_filter_31_10]